MFRLSPKPRPESKGLWGLCDKRGDGADRSRGTETIAAAEIQPIPLPVPHSRTGDNLGQHRIGKTGRGAHV
jgi:hypothetical protein